MNNKYPYLLLCFLNFNIDCKRFLIDYLISLASLLCLLSSLLNSDSNGEESGQALQDDGQWYDVHHGCLQHLDKLLESLSTQLQCEV